MAKIPGKIQEAKEPKDIVLESFRVEEDQQTKEPKAAFVQAEEQFAPPVRTIPDINDDMGSSYQKNRGEIDARAIIEEAKRASVVSGKAQIQPEPIKQESSVFTSISNIGSDIVGGIKETPRGIATGILGAGQEVMETIGQLGQVVEDAIPVGGLIFDKDGLRFAGAEEFAEFRESQEPLDIRFIEDPETATGQTVKAISQFLTGFIPALKLTKGMRATRVGKALQPTVAGSIADPLVFDEQLGRVSNLIQEAPILQNPVTEFLAADENDSVAYGKLKQTLEGAGLGVLTDSFVGSMRIIRKVRQARNLEQSTNAVERELAEARASSAGVAREIPEEQAARLGNPEAELVEFSPEFNEAARGFMSGQLDEVPDKAVNINMARIGGPDDVREIIARTAKTFESEFDVSVQGFDQTTRLANDIAVDPERVKSLLSQEGAFTAQEVTALRFLLQSSGKNLRQLAEQASTASADDVTLFEFKRQLAFHNALQKQVSSAAKEAGRALGAFRITAEGSRETDRALRELIQNTGGSETARRMAQELATIQSEQGLNIASRQMAEATTGDMILEAWINGLLSNPQTHIVNVMGNSLTAGLQPPERWLASSLRRIAGGEGVRGGEAAAMMHGTMSGIKDGLRLAGKALKTGEATDAFSKLEMRRQNSITAENLLAKSGGKALNKITGGSLEQGGVLAGGVDLLGEAYRVPGRLLTAGDEFFKSVGYRMELHAMAFRQASSEGLGGDRLATRINELVSNPPENIRLASIDAARYVTFTQPLGPAGRAIQQISNSHPAAKVILPFVRTPVNIIKFTAERTPFAPIMKQVRDDIAAGGTRRDLAVARIGLGSFVMAAAADMASTPAPIPGAEGIPYLTMVTGGGPADRNLAKSLRQFGWQPYSFWAGDQYVSFTRLDPVGGMLGIAADMSQIMGQVDEADAMEMAAATVMAVSNNVTSKTWMQGVSEFFDIVSEGVSADVAASQAARFGIKLAGSAVPAGVAQIARLTDPTWRQADSVVQAIKARIPGMSDEVPPNLNLWGEPILFHGGWGPDIASPLWASPIKGFDVEVRQLDDGTYGGFRDGELVDTGASKAEARWNSMMLAGSVEREMVRNEAGINMPQRSIRGVELSQAQYNTFVRLAGNELKADDTGMGARETLDAIINGRHPLSFEYASATDGPDGGKAKIIRDVILGFREAARATMIATDPELRDKVEEMQINRVEALGLR